MPEIIKATTEEHFSAAVNLFTEYAEWLNIDLSFQHFDEELSSVQSMYNNDAGGIILVKEAGTYIACVAVRKSEPSIAELKRMYVRPAFQQKGIGKQLLDAALALAKSCGYQKIRLDTLNTMLPAMKLYTDNGFYEIPAYYFNPEKTAVYFEKEL